MRPMPAAVKSSSVFQPTRRDATCSTAEQTTARWGVSWLVSSARAIAEGTHALSLPRPMVKVRP